LFDEKEMKNENPVVDGEFQRAESNPTFWLFQDMDKRLWGENYSRKNTIGDHDIILTATTEKMRTIQQKYYYPNNSILVIAGDTDHNEVFKKTEEIFGSWKASDFDPFVKYPIPEFAPLQKDELFFTENANAKNNIILLAWHGPDTRHDLPSTYAADVFSFILEQKSSEFQQEIIDSGLAYFVNFNYQTCKYTGPINLIMVPNPQKISELLAKIDEQMSRWDSDTYFTDEQLATAKRLLAIDDARRREQTSEFVHTVTYWWASASVDYYTDYVENLSKVSRADIRKYIDTYVKGKPRITGVLTTPEARPELEASIKTVK
jgi:zinc protease